ncbi:hydroxymethylbilane synthase [Cellulomonas cellasea]|uniref:hydroxymethylbilane synthase n=1 Tax=Cellulomonas cellasea TaxID=43670 RepID=UPI0025A4C2F1|nr:hydroxymethylbilane synthase [Cellulomonas cellasea]MDM8086473.1 hydroxymethylbilane synthase [Cellulomonas cellasea]
MPTTVRIGTRASALALTQTGHVATALSSAGTLDAEIVHVRTDGDRLTGSLSALGGTGVFVTALRDALLAGDVDVAVHSLKDLPTAPMQGISLGAVPPREDPRDVLCAREGWTIATLPTGARVGTGSPRRKAQLLAARPDLDVVDIRGNVDTRLGRVAPGDLDAVILARAGLARLGRLDAVTEVIDPAVMTPAPGQGALGVEVRSPGTVESLGEDLAAALAALDDPRSRLAVFAERTLLFCLEAGCAAPVGALAWIDETTPDDPRLTLDAVVISLDGSAQLRRSGSVRLNTPQKDLGHPLLPTTLGPVVYGKSPYDDLAIALGRAIADDLLASGAAAIADIGPRTADLR